MIPLRYVTKPGKNLCRHYSISHKKVIQLLKLQKCSQKKKFLPKRSGERYASALTNMHLSNKVYKHFGTKNLKEYIKEFIRNNS